MKNTEKQDLGQNSESELRKIRRHVAKQNYRNSSKALEILQKASKLQKAAKPEKVIEQPVPKEAEAYFSCPELSLTLKLGECLARQEKTRTLSAFLSSSFKTCKRCVKGKKFETYHKGAVLKLEDLLNQSLKDDPEPPTPVKGRFANIFRS